MTRNAQIWLLHRGEKLTQREIGVMFGVSTGRVHQIVHATEAKMARRWQYYLAIDPPWLLRLKAANALFGDDFGYWETLSQ